MEEITNDEMAANAIEKICDYLRKAEKLGNERVNAELARKFCDELLDAVDADSHGGCPLCQG